MTVRAEVPMSLRDRVAKWEAAGISNREFNQAVREVQAVLPDEAEEAIRSVLYGLVVAGYRWHHDDRGSNGTS